MSKSIVITLATCVLLSSCGSVSKSFTQTGDISYPAILKDCTVSIYTTRPKKEFDELGIIDFSIRGGPFMPDIHDAGYIKEYVKEDVCKAGGNAILLWESLGMYYSKVTIIKTK